MGDAEQHLDRIEIQVRDIRRAISGDELGNEGLIYRIEKVEGEIESFKSRFVGYDKGTEIAEGNKKVLSGVHHRLENMNMILKIVIVVMVSLAIGQGGNILPAILKLLTGVL